MTTADADLVVVGLGAAGLMAAIQARRAAPHLRVMGVDSAERLGRKILISGGGRCNVTHQAVDPADFHGATAPARRKVLRRFGVDDVRDFFRAEGVTLKQEETGKLFPRTNRARTVLDALVGAARDAGCTLHHPFRVQSLQAPAAPGGLFRVASAETMLHAPRVLLATGGRSVPVTGSDGHGLQMAQALGHGRTSHLLPALAPLTVDPALGLAGLKGVTLPVALDLRTGTGARHARIEGSTVLTHFGLSGPGPMDASRVWLHLIAEDPAATCRVDWLPDQPAADSDAWLAGGGKESVVARLATRLPARLAGWLAERAGLDADTRTDRWTRAQRREVVQTLHALPLPLTGTRGWNHAEATAGGIPLDEVRLDTLESRRCPGLHLAGEILDVDGRIGGFNFQWAWASGFVAGIGAARAHNDASDTSCPS